MNMKYIWLLMASILCFSQMTHANPSAAARAAEAIRKQQAAVRIAQEQSTRAMNAAAQSRRIEYAKQTAAARSRAAFEQQARTQAAAKHTEFLRVNAQQAQANRQRLAIQSHVKQQVDIAKKTIPVRQTTRVGAFNNNANPGLIYQRRTAPSDVYIGQTKNLQRYPVRQAEHEKKMRMSSTYELVGGAPAGNSRLLRVAEQAAYDVQSKYATKLNLNLKNAIRPMSEPKYLKVTGR